MARHRAFALAAFLFVSAPFVPAAVDASATQYAHRQGLVTTDTAVPADEVTDTTLVWRIENDPSECIGFLPKPGCGYEPTDAGERGGALQITLFFVLLGAVGLIATVVVRNVIRRDRTVNAQHPRTTRTD
ncbi:MAG: hypothetical protein ACO3IB_15015 [Phycisphaerales bacterium]